MLDPDPILYWNAVALEANRTSHTLSVDKVVTEQTGPTLSSRALAIIHLALYDAFAGVRNTPATLPAYLPNLPAAGAGATEESAIAAAAYRTLSVLYPSQQATFDQALLDRVNAGLVDTMNAGYRFGIIVANEMLKDRGGDPSAASTGYVTSNLRYHHRVDPDNPGQGLHAPFYGANSKGFAITNRHEIAPPPRGGPVYENALKQVRGKGIAPELIGTLPPAYTARTATETVIGIYWGYDGAAELGTPPRLYNQIVREVAMVRNKTVEENARLFALVNAAMGDAGILAWDQKYKHDFWRPVVAIREHDLSMGPGATTGSSVLDPDCDSGWLPLGGPGSNRSGKNFTPSFPAYPSGHATFGAAALHMVRLFYDKGGRLSKDTLVGDDLFDGMKFVSDEFNGSTTDNRLTVRPRHVRKFPNGGLWEMIEENGLSRVYLGVHWVFDAFMLDDQERPNLTAKQDGLYIGGVPLGLQIAEDIFDASGLKAPVPKKSTVAPRP